MALTKRDLGFYFEQSEKIDLLNGRIERFLRLLKNEIEGTLNKTSPQQFGTFHVPPEMIYALQCYSYKLQESEYCPTVVRVVGPGVFCQIDAGKFVLPAILVGPIYGILPDIANHFQRLLPGLEPAIKKIMEVEV
jgi:hypothetical protein